MVETLTDLDVSRLSESERGRKAIRIIYDQAAALGRVRHLTDEYQSATSTDIREAIDGESDVEREVDEMFKEEPCRAATHGPRNSTCTCEDSRDE